MSPLFATNPPKKSCTIIEQVKEAIKLSTINLYFWTQSGVDEVDEMCLFNNQHQELQEDVCTDCDSWKQFQEKDMGVNN